ncbi:hypothetical protein [Mesorhizobium sp. LCM 4576]|uniref:hypothetical protein n=1 Tax=Mesorhizobium sp. LCM 4576 TaxID=1848289 RepID=UPI0010422CE4|nr:hypothetical protein [Mesorhizobium sp. LCM 4576]
MIASAVLELVLAIGSPPRGPLPRPTPGHASEGQNTLRLHIPARIDLYHLINTRKEHLMSYAYRQT